MIPRECKRLAEVDFPIAEVSRHAAKEKSIRHGHPSTLHLWWARRPLASSRAVLMALLLPDPCDPHCPKIFKQKARKILSAVRQAPTNDSELRRGLLSFIANFADWKNAADPTHLDVGRALVKAAHGEESPFVVDPFAGGGSIPLEALRLGCEAFASDLNPVACSILKVMLEDIPRYGLGLAEELRRVGGEIWQQAEQELVELYPKDPDGATPITFLWVRTVRCEAPNCGAEIPLMRSFWLCKKATRRRALRYRVMQFGGRPRHIEFEVFEPKSESDVCEGTISSAKATCLCCGFVLAPARVRAQLAAERGGADVIFDSEGHRIGGARLSAVVTLKPGRPGRHYRPPTNADYRAVWRSQKRLERILAEWTTDGKREPSPVPDEPLPLMSGTFNVPLYGVNTWGDLFTARQKVALMEFARLALNHCNDDTVGSALGMVIGRCADYGSSGVMWANNGEFAAHTFGRPALPMVWDFAEVAQLTDSSGNFEGAIDWVLRVIKAWPGSFGGQVHQADAINHPLPDQSAEVWFTDPPYYFAIPYADLSDFFYVWQKRSLPRQSLFHDSRFSENSLTPKEPEICEMAHWDRDRYAHKDKQFFEDRMATAFTEGRRVLKKEGVGSVVFAHTTTEGWEALLSGMIRGGWTITGSWPISTERSARLRARNSAALATSVHLICRPRPENASIGDWSDILRELPPRVGEWIERLQRVGIRGADLVFACIGPALEVFSRYRAVETAEGDRVGLSEYLEKVWEVVGRIALQRVLGTTHAGALEEDARLTALFLWTIQNSETGDGERTVERVEDETVAKTAAKGFSLPFDVVRRFAQPMGINLDTWGGRIIGQKKGVVRLLPVAERAEELFGNEGAAAMADRIERNPHADIQQRLFSDLDKPVPSFVREPTRRYGGSSGDNFAPTLGNTTLDRVHTAMLFQSSGHSNALRGLIAAEQERGPDFLRLANALSALYPRGSNEKRLLDAMLLSVTR